MGVTAVVVLGSAAVASGVVRAEPADADDVLLPGGGRVEVTASSPAYGSQRIVVGTEGGHTLVVVEQDGCPGSYAAVEARTGPRPHLGLEWKRPCGSPPAPPQPPPSAPAPAPPTPDAPEPTPRSPAPPSPPRVSAPDTAPEPALPVPDRPDPPSPSKAAARPRPEPKPKAPAREAPERRPVAHRAYRPPPRGAADGGTPLTTLALLLTAPAVLAGAALRPRSGSSRGGGRGR